MPDRATREATYDDVKRAPPGVIAQIVDGLLELQPRPAIPHSIAASALASSLGSRYGRGRGGPGGWVLVFEPELHLGAHVLVPDFAGWRVERMPRVPRVPFLTIAPDWVCEVLSPSTASLDRIRKMRAYFEQDVAHVWLIDPDAKTLEVFRRESDGWKLAETHEGDVSVSAEPFDAEPLDLSLLWIPSDPEE